MNNAQTAASNRSKGGLATGASSASHRERILKVAMVLLAKGGRDALTTRAVAGAARVQPPILYRLFGDKAGLLNEVAEYGFSVYMAKKRIPAMTEDPVKSLRSGWRQHIQFGLTHPELYLLMYADPHKGKKNRAAESAHGMLRNHMQLVAEAGRLRVSVEQAAQLFHAAACGSMMVLLGITDEQRDMSLSDRACDAALAAIVTDHCILPAPTVAGAATTFRALVTGLEAHKSGRNVFTDSERALLVEWLDRLVKARSRESDKWIGNY